MIENNMYADNKTGNAVLDAIAELKKNLPEDVLHQADSITDLVKEPTEEELMAEYAKHHAPLTTAFHRAWKGLVIKDIHTLPLDKAVSKRYSSRYECEKAAKEAIKHVYEIANKYVTVTESKCVARATASRYADTLMDVFMEHKEALHSLSKALGKNAVYQQIEKMIYGCKKALRECYEE